MTTSFFHLGVSALPSSDRRAVTFSVESTFQVASTWRLGSETAKMEATLKVDSIEPLLELNSPAPLTGQESLYFFNNRVVLFQALSEECKQAFATGQSPVESLLRSEAITRLHS